MRHDLLRSGVGSRLCPVKGIDRSSKLNERRVNLPALRADPEKGGNGKSQLKAANEWQSWQIIIEIMSQQNGGQLRAWFKAWYHAEMAIADI